ncbi:MAG: phosphoribosyltransferase family protein, partial [Pirellulaceae bacterium]|nr:phosphoribosyltransferase family protein [Pirellulaceae bacterium]
MQLANLLDSLSQTLPVFMRIVTLHDETKVRVLLSEDDIQQGVKRLADDLSQQYGKKPLTIIGVMTGSIILLADLIRMLEMPLRVGVVQTSSYRSGTERGELRINDSMMLDIRDREVLLIDDIFDTGHTLSRVVE